MSERFCTRGKAINCSKWGLLISSLLSLAVSILLTVGVKCDFAENIIDLIRQVLLSYVAATIFYWVTEVYKESVRRKQQKWLIYDALSQFCDLWKKIVCAISYDSRFDRCDVQNFFVSDKDAAQNKNALLNFTKKVEIQVLQLVSLNLAWKEDELKRFYAISNNCHIIETRIDYVQEEDGRTCSSIVEALRKLDDLFEKITTDIQKDTEKDTPPMERNNDEKVLRCSR